MEARKAAPLPATPPASTPLSPPASPLPPTVSPSRANGNNNNANNNNWWHHHHHHASVLEQTVSYVKQDLEVIVAASPFLQTAQPKEAQIALFSRHEIITASRPLGKGGFSCVYEIVELCLDDDITAQLSPRQAQLRRHYQQQVAADAAAVAAVAASASSASSLSCSSSPRFVIKHLQERLLVHPKAFCCAASDLAVEAAYMSALDHPNICKVRGLPIQGLDAYVSSSDTKNGDRVGGGGGGGGRHDGYFIMLDRLHDTLDQCIEKEEQEIQHQLHQQQQQQQQQLMNNNNSNSTSSHCTRRHRLSRSSLEKKTTWALQIAQALAYLHQRRIVFRDLKPSNIGLDVNGNIQLFDFGLCRELPAPSCPFSTPITPCTSAACNKNIINFSNIDENHDYHVFCCSFDDQDHHHNENGFSYSSSYCDEVYEMSGVGTRRYMAVEIINTHRYNCKADVYSWAMCVYELLTLEKPFATYSMEDHQLFCCQNGERPSLHQRLLYKTSTTNNNNNSNQQQQPQHESSSSSSLAVRKMIAKVLEQSWCESVCNRFDIHKVCQAITEVLRTMATEEMRNIRNNNNSIGNTTTSYRHPISGGVAAASAKPTTTASDIMQPDSPVGVSDIRLLFPLALEFFGSGGGSSDYYNSGGGDDEDNDASSSLETADFRDDAPTTTMERQEGQVILLLKRRPVPSSSSSPQGGSGGRRADSIPSHLFLPDIHPLLLSSHHHHNNNEQDDEHIDQDNDDDDDDRDNGANDDGDLQHHSTDTGRILYRPSSSYDYASLS